MRGTRYFCPRSNNFLPISLNLTMAISAKCSHPRAPTRLHTYIFISKLTTIIASYTWKWPPPHNNSSSLPEKAKCYWKGNLSSAKWTVSFKRREQLCWKWWMYSKVSIKSNGIDLLLWLWVWRVRLVQSDCLQLLQFLKILSVKLKSVWRVSWRHLTETSL